ncbi:hypothetical protein PITC_084720 [Penicillium italicum]|uniref:Uncharacterized protein n=1 Tax=Penicillium italicum TaxID=40296 RepID=A0A0A2LC98_PENIT|nr:hypothetical protein PITC_084720 [Penicillium italicum]
MRENRETASHIVTSLVSLDFRPNDNMQEQFTSGRSINPRPKWCHMYQI